MENTKTKKALFMSALSMVLCIAMLIGMTFAWFTDTASTGVNKIQAGNLDVQLLMRDEANSGAYKDISDATEPIFGPGSTANMNNQSTLWEPGKTQVAYLAVRNAGNLALKYNIVLNIKDSGLADALQYAIVPQRTLTGESQTFTETVGPWSSIEPGLKDRLPKVKVTAAPNGCLDEIASDSTKVNETEYFALVIHMDEAAGNEYQGKDVSIDVTVVATQKDAESDSYSKDYDKGAVYPVSSQSEFETALANEGATIDVPKNMSMTLSQNDVINTGVTLSGAGKDKTTLKTEKASVSKDNVTIKNMTIEGSGSVGTGGTLNIGGNNTTIENVDYKGDGNIAVTVSTGANNEGTVFRNTKITNAFRGIQFWSLSGDSMIDNCVLDVAGYTFNIDAAVAGSTLTIKDSTLNGWTSYTSGIELVSFKNCKLGRNAYQYLRPYSETKITDCEFTSAGYKLNAGGSDAYTIAITDCKKNGTEITKDNVKSLLLDTDDWNRNATLIVNGTKVTL